MGATGHGYLIAGDDEDCEDGDKTPWGISFLSYLSTMVLTWIIAKLRKEFPWYQRMHALMSDNPVFDTKACSNSASSLDEGLQDILRDNSSNQVCG